MVPTQGGLCCQIEHTHPCPLEMWGQIALLELSRVLSFPPRRLWRRVGESYHIILCLSLIILYSLNHMVTGEDFLIKTVCFENKPLSYLHVNILLGKWEVAQTSHLLDIIPWRFHWFLKLCQSITNKHMTTHRITSLQQQFYVWIMFIIMILMSPLACDHSK